MQHRKLCRNIVDKLKRKMLIVTKKIMSRQFPEAEAYKGLGVTNFYVVTQDTPVATRTRLLDQKSVVTLSRSIAT